LEGSGSLGSWATDRTTLSNPNTAFIHNPQTTVHTFTLQQWNNDALEQGEHERLCLSSGAQDKQSVVLVWRVGPNVGKVEIQPNQGPPLVAADIGHVWIRLADHLFVVNGCRLVSGGL
jgi:hypothetical protein